MCRLFGMTGGRKRVQATFWLLDAPDSLALQSRAEPDGTGLGVYSEDGTAVVHHCPIAAYEDAQFAHEAREVKSTTFIAHIRYATTGAVAIENTHPFEQKNRLFAHNGVLGRLSKLERHLGEYMSCVKGDTDSERFFALITKEADHNGGDITAAIATAAQWASKNISIFALNIILTTATDIWALRYPDKHELFMLEREAGGVHGGKHFEGASAAGRVRVRSAHLADNPAVVFASEKLDEHPEWRPLQSGELVHVGPDLKVESQLVVAEPPTIPLHLHELSERAAKSQQ